MDFCVCLQGALLIWEQFEEADHHSFHSSGGVCVWLLMALRVSLAVFLASVLYQMVSAERSALKRDFYLSFAKANTLLLLSDSGNCATLKMFLFLKESLLLKPAFI